MSTNDDYRKWMNDNYPAILEGFYKTAEMGGYNGAHEADAEAWHGQISNTEDSEVHKGITQLSAIDEHVKSLLTKGMLRYCRATSYL